ncbi:hypothetical protein AYO28_17105 [Pseudomonas putida]|uniref:Uncharacterized protein n=1 Tax=Pseudomonas putida TaxID=303 RepID=A0A177SNT2_PSEPU|nr:hypothetical protein AYO28_17105 [Pseudomonas putida]
MWVPGGVACDGHRFGDFEKGSLAGFAVVSQGLIAGKPAPTGIANLWEPALPAMGPAQAMRLSGRASRWQRQLPQGQGQTQILRLARNLWELACQR